jgi:hypothetical protein
MKALPPVLFLLTISLGAQELLPLVAPLAQKFDADTEALIQQRTAAMEPLKKPYRSILENAEKDGRTVKTVSVKAMAREHQWLDMNLLAPMASPDLPSPVQTARRSLWEAMGRVGTDFAGRQTRLGTGYLGRLAAFPVGRDPVLAAQIAEQKEHIKMAQLAANNAPGLTRNMVVNGDFSVKGGDDGAPAGWKLTSGNVEIVTEGGNSFVRLYGVLDQEVCLPSYAREVTFSVRARTFKPGRPQYYLFYPTAAGSERRFQGESLEKIGGQWATFTRPADSGQNVPTVTVRLEVRDGITDFDDFVFEMK